MTARIVVTVDSGPVVHTWEQTVAPPGVDLRVECAPGDQQEAIRLINSMAKRAIEEIRATVLSSEDALAADSPK